MSYQGVTLNTNGDYWQASWTSDTGERKRKGLGHRSKVSKSEARRKCRAIQAEHDDNPGRINADRAPVLAVWTDRYLAMHPEYKAGTAKLYGDTIKHLLGHIGATRPIDKITRADASSFRTHLAAKMSEQTVRKHLRNCRAIFGLRGGAMRLDLIPFNPFDREPCAPIKVQAKTYITIDQGQQLLDACPSPAWRSLIGLTRLAGLRLGEAKRLTWTDVDWQQRRLAIVPEDGRDGTKQRHRTVPMSPELHGILLAGFDAIDQGDSRVVPLGENNLRRSMLAIIRRAQLDQWPKLFHALRASCEQDWLARYPQRDVCEWIGHDASVSAANYRTGNDSAMSQVAGLEEDELTRLRRRVAELEAQAKEANDVTYRQPHDIH